MDILKRHKILPGFGLTLGYTVFYMSFILLIPLMVLFLKTASLSWEQFWGIVATPRVLAAFRLSIGASIISALINSIFGLMIAWVLTRYSFPGKKLMDSLIDLPFAMPTAVAGIALTSIYSSNGWVGRFLEPLGVKVAFAPLGVIIALTFIGLPFVVRTVQPVLEDFEKEIEEAAASLGASRGQTFLRVIFPTLIPSWLTGFTLAFSRALGEYGSVVFISGNMPMRTEIVPLLIITKLEQFEYSGATAIAVVMLVLSFLLLLLINLGQWWNRKRYFVMKDVKSDVN
ncbi:MAG TPA: sulfate ABC transporter permease subunit CysT [Firmicutes bacterium]|jgi:sulfate/thiosulfate transport system permease protein|nr:sulfate ABC transporter permease subunit CysT [Bacillota bacterium]